MYSNTATPYSLHSWSSVVSPSPSKIRTVMNRRRKAFEYLKEKRLLGVDLSKKGSIDAAVLPIVDKINSHPDFFTTSSCSGRILLYEKGTLNCKKGCKWLYVSHEMAQNEDVLFATNSSLGSAYFKFEAMIMHVQCFRLDFAKQMMDIATASGFRNSGISIGKAEKFIVAIRGTGSLECPITLLGKPIVSEEYITHITGVANDLMKENLSRVLRLQTGIMNWMNLLNEQESNELGLLS